MFPLSGSRQANKVDIVACWHLVFQSLRDPVPILTYNCQDASFPDTSSSVICWSKTTWCLHGWDLLKPYAAVWDFLEVSDVGGSHEDSYMTPQQSRWYTLVCQQLLILEVLLSEWHSHLYCWNRHQCFTSVPDALFKPSQWQIVSYWKQWFYSSIVLVFGFAVNSPRYNIAGMNDEELVIVVPVIPKLLFQVKYNAS